ncbi:MAG TPA: RNA methyltransferase [bacterium]|nr:RNA methyltransferase [bacterium]
MKKILTRFNSHSLGEHPEHIERFPIHVVLENIRSLYNVGSIFRTADAVRIASLHICGITGRPPRKEIAKTALGAQDTVPWEYYESGAEAVRRLQRQGVRVFAVEHTDSGTGLWSLEFTFPVAFVFGYEIEGIEDETLAACDGAVEIPMYGSKGSLNVAVACAVMLYETLRRFERLRNGESPAEERKSP